MAGPLPHPAEPEFALRTIVLDSEPSLSPSCPFSCCFQGCAWVLAAQGRAKLRLSCRAWPITPATCFWIIPEAEQEPGEGGSQACSAPSWSTGWGAPGTLLSPRQDLSPLSPGVCLQPRCHPLAEPRQDSIRGAARRVLLSSLPPASSRRSLPWPSRPLPVPGSPGKSSAVFLKAKSRLRGAGQPWPGAAGRWQPGSGRD